MAERKPEWPKVGNLVIDTVETVTDCGAYAEPDEYDKRGLLHAAWIAKAGGQNTSRREK